MVTHAGAGVKALLGGKPLLGTSDVSWTLKDGTRPHIAQFDMIPDHADELDARTGPVRLEMDRLTVEHLYVLHVAPGDNPEIKRVVVADRRWFWSYKWIRRFYNIRRDIGFKRISDPLTPPEASRVEPAVWYAKWSLHDEVAYQNPEQAKWKADEILKDLIATVGEKEREHSGQVPSLALNVDDILASLKKLPVEMLFLNDAGDRAIARALTYIPEGGLYIDYDGEVVIYSKVSGGERAMVSLAGPEVVGQGDVLFVENSKLRPKEIHCLFQYEPEIRIDADETAGMTVTDDTRFADNVLPSPDFSVGLGHGVEICQGTYITFDEAFAVWGAPPGLSGPLTHDLVQKAMVPFMDLWAGIEIAGAFAPDNDWVARIAAVQQHYRRTYRINRHWMDRIFALRAYRVATINPQKGTRAPAIAYADYCLLTGQRALFNEAREGVSAKDFSYAVNVKVHPAKLNEAGANKALTEDSKGAPAEVLILDADQGIIHLDFMIDPYRLFEAVLPSMMTLSGKENDLDGEGRPKFAGPSADITNRGRPVTFDAVGKSHVDLLPKLTKNHKVSIILTAIPASPNDERVFHHVKVKPSEVNDLVPAEARKSLGRCRGPIMEIAIGAAIETARIPWLDARKADIEKLFGIGRDKQPADLTDLVLNDSANDRGASSLRAIANAQAARLWASLTDRYEGEMAGDMNGEIRPAGWLSEVRQTVTTRGELFTKLTLPERIEPIDVLSFLDSSTRAILLKLATPERTQ